MEKIEASSYSDDCITIGFDVNFSNDFCVFIMCLIIVCAMQNHNVTNNVKQCKTIIYRAPLIVC